jgi:hypothetical protein
VQHYGICQGQSTANLKKMAGEAGVKISNFVPPEAESSEDVKKRAIAFFKVKKNKLFKQLSFLETSNGHFYLL